jgi:hypothetical protein
LGKNAKIFEGISSMLFLTERKTNWRNILIVVIFALIASIGILAYSKKFEKEISLINQFFEIEKISNKNNWRVYRNEVLGYEISYPANFFVFESPFHSRISSEPDSGTPNVHPWFRKVGPHEKVTIEIFRVGNPKNRSVDFLLSKSERGEKVVINGQEAIREIDEKFPAILTQIPRDDGFVYVIRGVSGSKKYFEEFKDLILKIKNSFKFIEQKEKRNTGVKPAEKLNWWIYENKKYKYSIEFPDEVTIEDFEDYPERGIFEDSRVICVRLENDSSFCPFRIEVPLNFHPKKINFSKEEFIKRFVIIESPNPIFDKILDTFKFIRDEKTEQKRIGCVLLNEENFNFILKNKKILYSFYSFNDEESGFLLNREYLLEKIKIKAEPESVEGVYIEIYSKDKKILKEYTTSNHSFWCFSFKGYRYFILNTFSGGSGCCIHTHIFTIAPNGELEERIMSDIYRIEPEDLVLKNGKLYLKVWHPFQYQIGRPNMFYVAIHLLLDGKKIFMDNSEFKKEYVEEGEKAEKECMKSGWLKDLGQVVINYLMAGESEKAWKIAKEFFTKFPEQYDDGSRITFENFKKEVEKDLKSLEEKFKRVR